MDPAPGGDVVVSDAETDANERVHHHAHTEQVKPGAVVTLCGLVLEHGPRPDAASMPCCPMCGAEMEALGQRCSRP
jgi:tRNA(Ile2) C34 agmatinyltransferase TiaS